MSLPTDQMFLTGSVQFLQRQRRASVAGTRNMSWGDNYIFLPPPIIISGGLSPPRAERLFLCTWASAAWMGRGEQPRQGTEPEALPASRAGCSCCSHKGHKTARELSGAGWDHLLQHSCCLTLRRKSRRLQSGARK